MRSLETRICDLENVAGKTSGPSGVIVVSDEADLERQLAALVGDDSPGVVVLIPDNGRAEV